MSGQFTLLNYMDNKPFDNSRIVVSDGRNDPNMVHITVEGNTVKVNGKEMIKAIENLMRINYPYL